MQHVAKCPMAYQIEPCGDGRVNVWLCRQVDTYVTEDGIREYDVDMRVKMGVRNTPTLEASLRKFWETWWALAALSGEQRP